MGEGWGSGAVLGQGSADGDGEGGRVGVDVAGPGRTAPAARGPVRDGDGELLVVPEALAGQRDRTVSPRSADRRALTSATSTARPPSPVK